MSRVDIDHHRAHQGSMEEFESEWAAALETGDPRHFAYPTDHPSTQVELFEREKARQIDAILAAKGIAGGTTLEYGCGSAGMSIYLANKGFTAYALDTSLTALRVAEKNHSRNRSNQVDSFHLVAGDAFKMPFADGTFDIVMSYGLLEHFDEDVADILLRESVRVLKPGGLLLADIIPGGFSVRTFGMLLSFAASFCFRLLSGDFKRLRGLWRAYFHEFYETDLNDEQWKRIMIKVGLGDVEIKVCRPFPPLALSGYPEKLYIRIMQKSIRFWHWFDASGSWFSRRWGWMYLVAAAKPRRG